MSALPSAAAPLRADPSSYARHIEAFLRVRWDIDREVLRGRAFEFSKKFLPDGLTLVERLPFLGADQRRLYSQVQGRSYANIFALFEHFIGTKILEVSGDHRLGDQTAQEALVRFADDELKHQELFRRIESMIGASMPPGYLFLPKPNAVAAEVLGKSTWAVLALSCLIELITHAHYRASIEPDAELSPLYKDVFLFHWKEEAQHAILAEREWIRENAKQTPAERDGAVDDLIALVGAVDGILQAQADSDAQYFLAICGQPLGAAQAGEVKAAMLAAYRWQYIASGVQIPRFAELLDGMITPPQGARIGAALAPILG